MISLQTERLTLSTPVLGDFDGYAALWAEPAVMLFLSADGKPLSRFGAWQNFAGQVGHWQLRGFGMFTVRDRVSGDFIGRVGPWQPEGWPDFEIGWTLASHHWGRGYATEAAAACMRYAFDELQRPSVISLIAHANSRSIRVAERLGERVQCEVTLPPDKRVLQYGISREEWRARTDQRAEAGPS